MSDGPRSNEKRRHAVESVGIVGLGTTAVLTGFPPLQVVGAIFALYGGLRILFPNKRGQ